MAFLKKINQRARVSTNTGFGDNASNYGGRFLNKDGSANIRKTGIGLFERYSFFHSMLAMSGWHFFFVVLFFYILVNLLFAIVYYLVGVEYLGGMIAHNETEKFTEAFFFSAQTFTTVGYGRISPVGILASSIAAFQALMGLLSLAVATGLMYARFSKPTAFLKFSDNALIAPYKDGIALMMRTAPYKNTTLTEAEVKLTLGMGVEENGIIKNRFFSLELEMEKVNTLTLSWTLVHPITENSPLYGFTKEEFENNKGEVIVFLKAFDDMFSNTVVARTSYLFTEVIYGASFLPIFHRDSENKKTILDLTRINAYQTVSLPVQKYKQE